MLLISGKLVLIPGVDQGRTFLCQPSATGLGLSEGSPGLSRGDYFFSGSVQTTLLPVAHTFSVIFLASQEVELMAWWVAICGAQRMIGSPILRGWPPVAAVVPKWLLLPCIKAAIGGTWGKGIFISFPQVRALACHWASLRLHWLFGWHKFERLHVGSRSPTRRIGSGDVGQYWSHPSQYCSVPLSVPYETFHWVLLALGSDAGPEPA